MLETEFSYLPTILQKHGMHTFLENIVSQYVFESQSKVTLETCQQGTGDYGHPSTLKYTAIESGVYIQLPTIITTSRAILHYTCRRKGQSLIINCSSKSIIYKQSGPTES